MDGRSLLSTRAAFRAFGWRPHEVHTVAEFRVTGSQHASWRRRVSMRRTRGTWTYRDFRLGTICREPAVYRPRRQMKPYDAQGRSQDVFLSRARTVQRSGCDGTGGTGGRWTGGPGTSGETPEKGTMPAGTRIARQTAAQHDSKLVRNCVECISARPTRARHDAPK